MHIKQLNIESLGSIKDLSHQSLAPGVNALVGNNGVGKSTTRNAIKFALFGLPADDKSSVPHVSPSYFSGKSPLRRVSAIITDGSESVKVTRESQDKKASTSLICEPASQEKLFKEYLGSVSKDDFENIWSMSEFDVNAIDPTNSDAIKRFLASQYGLNTEPNSVLNALKTKNKEHTTTAARGSGFAKSRKDYLESYDKYQKLIDMSHNTFQASQDLEQAEAQTKECSALREEKSQELARLREVQKTEQSIRHDLNEAEVTLSRLQKELDAMEASAPGAPNEELLALKFKIMALSKDLENYQEKKSRLDELKTEQKMADTELHKYPDISFSHTRADWEYARTNAQDILNAISQAEHAYEAAAAYVEQKQLANERLIDSQEVTTTKTFTTRMMVTLLATTVVSFAATIVLALLSAPQLALVTTALIGIVIVGLEFAVFTNKSKKTSNVSPAVQNAQDELTSLIAQKDAAKATWQKAEDKWNTFVAQNFPGSDAAKRDELMRGILSAQEILALEKRIEDNRLKITEGMQFLLSKEETFKSFFAKCYPGEPAPDNFSTLVALCQTCMDEEIQRENAFKEYLLQKRDIDRQMADLARTREDLLDKQEQILAMFECPASEFDSVLNERISRLDDATTELDDQIRMHSVAIGQNNQIIEGCFDQEELDNIQAALQNRLSHVYSKAHDYLVAKMAEQLLTDALVYFNKNSAPAIIEESNAIFNRITDGEFAHILFPQEKGKNEADTGISVIDKNGSEFTPDTLSLGTMRQLYLSIRFGVIQAQSKERINVPIVLDEILASFDETRRDAAVAEINELAKQHQVFYFSARDDVIQSPNSSEWNTLVLNEEKR